MIIFFLPAVLACLITGATTPLVIKLAKKYRLIDDSSRKHPAKTHKGAIPRAGGLAIFAGILIAVVIFLPLQKTIIGILLAAFVTVFIGTWDDQKDVSPYTRFFGNICTALIVVGAGVGIPFITNPFGEVLRLDLTRITFDFLGTHSILIWADLFAIVWIVWTMNIVGWSAGVDGQMPGFVAIAAMILGIQSLRFSAHDVSQLLVSQFAFVTMGAFLGFLPWNFFPQKIMPGYGGKTLAGLLLATIAILSGAKVGSLLLLLAIPMLDGGFLLFRRILSRKSPFRADRNHLHHYLLDHGVSKPKIALFYWLVSLILGVATLFLTSGQKLFAFIMVAVIVAGIVYSVSKIGAQESE